MKLGVWMCVCLALSALLRVDAALPCCMAPTWTASHSGMGDVRLGNSATFAFFSRGMVRRKPLF